MRIGPRMEKVHASPTRLGYETPNAHLEQPKKLFILAAHDKKSLSLQREKLSFYLRDHSRASAPMFMENLAFTLGQRRSLLAWKIAYVTDSRENLVHELEQAEPAPLRATKEPELAFVFTGQGAQWYRMGRELIDAYPIFASTIHTITMVLINMGASYSLRGRHETVPHVQNLLIHMVLLLLLRLATFHFTSYSFYLKFQSSSSPFSKITSSHQIHQTKIASCHLLLRYGIKADEKQMN